MMFGLVTIFIAETFFNIHLLINLACQSGVCLSPIFVNTAEPIEPKFCVRPQVAPGKVCE